MLQRKDDFYGSRFANFTDLKTETWKSHFEELKKLSDEYLEKLEKYGLWPDDYKWPKNALQTNTRVWEYPYSCEMLKRYLRGNGTVLDIGSALTFFPHYLANQGYEVHATDIDRQVIDWYRNIETQAVFLKENPKFGKLKSYKLEDVTRLGFQNEMFDAVTNISVLEHLPYTALVRAVEEIYRVLKMNGVLICTLDVLINGEGNEHHSPLNQEELLEFISILSEKFQFVEDFLPVVPADMITNIRIPKELATASKGLKLSAKGRLRMLKKIILNEDLKREAWLEWGAFGFTLRKVG
jgi:2-polyprenyl-3-methyl-5-hydroxy-6-metoxy-1,4-benzoquinol methylase